MTTILDPSLLAHVTADIPEVADENILYRVQVPCALYVNVKNRDELLAVLDGYDSKVLDREHDDVLYIGWNEEKAGIDDTLTGSDDGE